MLVAQKGGELRFSPFLCYYSLPTRTNGFFGNLAHGHRAGIASSYPKLSDPSGYQVPLLLCLQRVRSVDGGLAFVP